MCVINFNIVTTGSSPIGAEGRYRLQGVTAGDWEIFSIDLNDMKTPDIIVNGQYQLQIRVQYPDLSYSDWTASSLIKIGSCSQLGNLYVRVEGSGLCAEKGIEDFDSIYFTSSPQSGTVCYVPALGTAIFKDSDLTVKVDAGHYKTYGSYAGCLEDRRVIVVNSEGIVDSIYNCES